MLIIYIIYNIYNIYFRQVGSLPNQEESVDSFRCFSEAQFQKRNASAHAKNFKLNMNVIIIFCVMLCMILCTTDIQPFMQGLHIMIIYIHVCVINDNTVSVIKILELLNYINLL